MSSLVIRYNDLSLISFAATRLAKKTDEYANDLSRKVCRKIECVTGGVTNNTSSAKYYVDAKINELKNKNSAYKNLSNGIDRLIETAKRVDKEVAKAISTSQEKFLTKHENLRISDWKAKVLNFLVDAKNKLPILDIIGDKIREMKTYVSDKLAAIKYWYKCEGGREKIACVAAFAGVVIAVALFFVTIPASGFVAICGLIAATIGVINAITNACTSYASMKAAERGDPAWAKIYGEQDKLSDVLRENRFKNGMMNRLSYTGATLLESTEIFCDIVNIRSAFKNFKLKSEFTKAFFDKETGLLSYMKKAKWEKVTEYDGFGNVVGTKMGLKVNKQGVVETKYTLSSVWGGIKAYVLNKPIDCNSDLGIRTVINKNFTDGKWKKLLKKQITGDGEISFSQWRKTFNFGAIKDTAKYNLKYSSAAGMFEKGLKWDKRREYIKTTANGFKSFMETSNQIEHVLSGDSSVGDEVLESLKKKGADLCDVTKICDKSYKLIPKIDSWAKHTYIYKRLQTT